jgi:hypothetical protein
MAIHSYVLDAPLSAECIRSRGQRGPRGRHGVGAERGGGDRGGDSGGQGVGQRQGREGGGCGGGGGVVRGDAVDKREFNL